MISSFTLIPVCVPLYFSLQTMLSIAKLSLLAEDSAIDASEALNEVNRQLRHIDYQDNIPLVALNVSKPLKYCCV